VWGSKRGKVMISGRCQLRGSLKSPPPAPEAKEPCSGQYAKTELTTQRHPRGEKIRDNGKRRYAMGDKGKKDKNKGRKQRISKQGQKAKGKIAKQLRKTP
jgi:hypothetical protein